MKRIFIVGLMILVLSQWCIATDVNQSMNLSSDANSSIAPYNITSDNVIFDCSGHSITGNGTGSGIIAFNRKNLTIKNCLITNFTSALNLSNTNSTAILNNTIINNAGFGIYLLQSNVSIYWNRIYSNNGSGSGIEVFSDVPLNMSYNYRGNYWGYSACPAFNYTTETNDSNVSDAYPYNQSYSDSAWPATASCVDQARIILISANYSNGLGVAGIGDTISFYANLTGITNETNQSATLNATLLGCSSSLDLVWNTSSGLWESSCTIASHIGDATYSFAAFIENIYGVNDSDSVDASVDTVGPVINLTSPANNSYITNITASTRFTFSAADSNTISNCTFIWNGSANMIKNASLTHFDNLSISVGPYSYLWSVNCTDILGNMNNVSKIFNITVDYSAPTILNNATLENSTIERTDNITIQLSETTINESTINSSTVILRDNSNSTVLSRILYSPGNITIDPYLYLDSNSTYNIVVGSIKDLAGNILNYSSPIMINTTILNLTDNDNVTGNSSYMNTNIQNLNLTLDNISMNYSDVLAGVHLFTVYDGANPILNMNYSFTSQDLDLSELTVILNELKTRGSVLVNGITPYGTKTVFVPKINSSYTGVCIRDHEISSITEISSDCTGSYEYWVNCTVNGTGGTRKCYYEGSYLKVTGLSNSGVVQMNNTIRPVITSLTHKVTNDDLDFTVKTDKNTKCKAKINLNYSYDNMNLYPDITNFTTTHSFEDNNIGDGDHTYYVACKDEYGNVVYDSFDFTIDTSSTTDNSNTDDTSGPSGGGSTSSTSTKIVARKSKVWNQLLQGENAIFDIDEDNIPITRIDFNVGIDNKEYPQMEVRVLDKKPSLVNTLSGEVYHFLEFYTSNLYAVRTPEINFRVAISWVVSNNVDPREIKLARYYNRKWTILNTTYKGKGTTYYTYQAESPGFSYFGITGTKTLSSASQTSTTQTSKTITGTTKTIEDSVTDQDVEIKDEPENKTTVIHKKPMFGLHYMRGSTKVGTGIAIMLLIVAGGLAIFRQYYSKTHYPGYHKTYRITKTIKKR